MIRVKATREGLIGQPTASGYVIDAHVAFVALPSRAALGRHVRLRNPANEKIAIAQVLDVGPHHTHDDEYVLRGERPQAERDPRSNRAGIDLGEAVWKALGMTDNADLEWEFIT